MSLGGALTNYSIVTVLLISWAVSDAATAVICRLATRQGWLDKPGAADHKKHQVATPTLGGLAMCLGFLVAIGITTKLDSVLAVLLWTAGGIVLTGVLDDLHGVSAVIKLIVLAIATTALVAHGISLHLLGWPVLDGVLTFLWIGFVSSAFNGLDNSDGAAAGVALIVGATVAAIAWGSVQPDLARLAVALAGACLGFLRHNFNPARIFMGDSGSFFLGYIVASILAVGHWSGLPGTELDPESLVVKSILVPVVILAVPIFDFMLILVLRGLDGKYRRWVDPIVMCGRDHTAHRLIGLGLSVREAVLALYLFSVSASSVALWMFNSFGPTPYVLFGLFMAATLSLALALRLVELRQRASGMHPIRFQAASKPAS
ncbi:MAG TPA: MraY family glycosyltransferase [Candidatus Xenobia bacterium]